MATILIPIPSTDFDPTEVAIPWSIFRAAGHVVVFATPDGKPGAADVRMVKGTGLGILAPMLMAAADARKAYQELENDSAFLKPISYAEINPDLYQALILPGGHAQGMKPYLESKKLQETVSIFFAKNKVVGAICHGVVLVARSKVLFGRKTTALPRWMELNAWASTCLWLGNYYRTYPQTVQKEVVDALASKNDFKCGPISLSQTKGFTVKDGNYVSARWPGDAGEFAKEILRLL